MSSARSCTVSCTHPAQHTPFQLFEFPVPPYTERHGQQYFRRAWQRSSVPPAAARSFSTKVSCQSVAPFFRCPFFRCRNTRPLVSTLCTSRFAQLSWHSWPTSWRHASFGDANDYQSVARRVHCVALHLIASHCIASLVPALACIGAWIVPTLRRRVMSRRAAAP